MRSPSVGRGGWEGWFLDFFDLKSPGLNKIFQKMRVIRALKKIFPFFYHIQFEQILIRIRFHIK